MGGGGVEDSSEFKWIDRAPPTVKTYKECFDSMVKNEFIQKVVTDQG